ncbi:hypothetical protein BDV95DRAFT_593395 [Massariosphaeria phaeospora]|uniref:C2H2-type domain-containing protein n=1 Tax=Massariosphaeria phaeospora TaxID=100035 RepID=A0A7C8ICW3_9PLEO|nr:hypothetical protein BDV95DRAFT_593395 [Massariosphaeria phaeospora]
MHINWATSSHDKHSDTDEDIDDFLCQNSAQPANPIARNFGGDWDLDLRSHWGDDFAADLESAVAVDGNGNGWMDFRWPVGGYGCEGYDPFLAHGDVGGHVFGDSGIAEYGLELAKCGEIDLLGGFGEDLGSDSSTDASTWQQSLQQEVEVALSDTGVTPPSCEDSSTSDHSSGPTTPCPSLLTIPPAQRPFNCTKCSARYVEHRQLKNHIRNAHSQHVCVADGCRATYRHAKSLWQHQQEKHKGIREWNLKRHVAKKHER